MSYILAIDQGTTSSRAFIYNKDFEVVGQGQKTFPQYYPQTGWVEHDLEEIWESVVFSIKAAISSVKEKEFTPEQIKAIGITNQRETFGLWERSTGKPVRKAVVWQCNRSHDLCQKLQKSRDGKKLVKISGLKISPYFSGTKLSYLLQEDSRLNELAKSGKIAFGTIDTFLLWRLSSGAVHATDTSNASRTLFFDIHKIKWSDTALKILKIPHQILPEIKDSNATFVKTTGLDFLPDGIPVSGILGDQQAALFGQGCFKKTQSKITYGTGAFMLINTGSHFTKSKEGVSTVAWTLNGKTTYAVESSVFIAGAAVQFLRDNLSLFQQSSEIEALASKVNSSDGVFFIPALTGLGSPYWRSEAKGLIGGLTRATSKENISRACLEGIALSVTDAFSALASDASVKIKKIRVDGGAAKNNLLMQIQSDVMNVELERPVDVETTVRGAAYAAAVGAGLCSLEDLNGRDKVEKCFSPNISTSQSKEILKTWRRRIKGLLSGAY